jgi:hypothetical protein
MFREGKTYDRDKDNPSPGRPISATSEKDISSVKAIVDEDARYTVEEISNMSGLSASYVFSYIICGFHLERKVTVKESVPHKLTSDQKRERIEKASAFLTRFTDRDPKRLGEIVIGDETWLYFFSPKKDSVTKCR